MDLSSLLPFHLASHPWHCHLGKTQLIPAEALAFHYHFFLHRRHRRRAHLARMMQMAYVRFVQWEHGVQKV